MKAILIHPENSKEMPFSKDIDRVSNHRDKTRVIKAIQSVKKAESKEQILGRKKLTGVKNAYRIRVGDLRIGVFIKGEVVKFARVQHRKDIYKMFP